MLSAVRRARAWCVLLALAFVVAVVPAQARAMDMMVEHFGDPGTQTWDSAFAAADWIGARRARQIVERGSFMQPFNYGYLDAFVDTTAAREMRPYLTLTNAYNSRNPLPESERVPSDATYASWCGEVATRYNGRNGHALVRDYSVWNEPNLTGVGRLRPGTYLAYYQACRAAILDSLRAAGVTTDVNVYYGELSTAPGPTGTIDGLNACDYLDRSLSPSWVYVQVETEGLAIHPYQFTTNPTTRSAGACEGIARLGEWNSMLTWGASTGALTTKTSAQVAERRAKLVISEFGYCSTVPWTLPAGAAQPACPQNAAGASNVRDEGTRAIWLATAIDWAARNGVAIFDYHGLKKRPLGNFLGNTGYIWESGIITNPENRQWTRDDWTLSVTVLRNGFGTVDPTASIGGAGDVGETTATLNGSVDPKGFNTTYHFEYGSTTAYGSSTPERTLAGNAGATSVSAGVTGLVPGRAYHVKLVVRNRAGSGESGDGAFRTVDRSKPAVVRGPDGVSRFMYFRDASGNLRETSWNGTAWGSTPFGVEIVGSPTAYVDGSVRVVYARGANGHLWQFYFNGRTWEPYDMGYEIAGDPAVLDNGPGTTRLIYARGANGNLWQIRYDGRQWVKWDTAVAIDGTPAPISTFVYVRTPDGNLKQISYDAGNDRWDTFLMGFAPLVGTPAVLADGGTHQIFLRGPEGHLRRVALEGRAWVNEDLGQGLVGDPAVIAGMVYVRDASGSLIQLHAESGRWIPWTLGFAAPAQGDPAGFGPYVYYRGLNGNLHQVLYNGRAWEWWDTGA